MRFTMMGLVVLGSSVRRFHFFGRRQAMLVGDGGSPMADAHEEKALLGLCNAHCLRPIYAVSRAQRAVYKGRVPAHIP